jgi:hypothetical protein
VSALPDAFIVTRGDDFPTSMNMRYSTRTSNRRTKTRDAGPVTGNAPIKDRVVAGDTRLRLSLRAPVISSGYCTLWPCKGIVVAPYWAKAVGESVTGAVPFVRECLCLRKRLHGDLSRTEHRPAQRPCLYCRANTKSHETCPQYWHGGYAPLINSMRTGEHVLRVS